MEQQQSRSDGHTSPAGQQDRKPYQPPAITYEAPLEVRAGSPLGQRFSIPDLTDPAGLWEKK
jgi:hypothetical protein